MKKVLFTILGLVVLLGAIVGLKATQIINLIGYGAKMQAGGMPPAAVATAVVQEEDWEESLEFVGSLRPVQGVMLTAEVGGIVAAIRVENGAEVQKGDVLLELETSQEKAEFASSNARLQLARINLERSRGLLEKKIVAKSDFDTTQAEFEAMRARIDNLQAIINKRIIRAPFSGRVGIRRINIGQTIKPGEDLIPVHQSNPIYVEFFVPQTRLAGITKGQDLRILSDGLLEPAHGKITAINPVVDEITRSALVQGLLQNPEDRLRAGQFAEVEVILPKKQHVLFVPSTAIVAQAFGNSVFVVEEKDGKLIARQQFVQTGMRRGDFVEITKGLKPGERVVSAGAFKLRNGMSVAPNDTMQPESSLTPHPKNS